jgi:pimeloyl-ACP methyl ester carboxylesterase
MNSTFNTDLNNTSVSIATDHNLQSQAMLLAFGGINGRLGMPPFEFFNLTAGFETQKIFVRDLHQAWYQYGLAGVTASVDETAQHLSKMIRAQNPVRVVVCGNSMGGYAALLFGLLLEVDVVYAFSPQTFINPAHRLQFFDFRWWRRIRSAYHAPQAQRETFNLQAFFAKHPPQKPKFHIFYSTNIRLDTAHATRLATAPRVTLHPFPNAGHDLVKHLRDTGQLSQILLEGLKIP